MEKLFHAFDFSWCVCLREHLEMKNKTPTERRDVELLDEMLLGRALSRILSSIKTLMASPTQQLVISA